MALRVPLAVLATVVLGLGVASIASAKPKGKIPKGAVIVKSSQIKTVKGGVCLKVRSFWEAGQVLSSSKGNLTFISFANLANNKAAEAKAITDPALKKKALGEMRKYRRQATTIGRRCRTSAPSRPVNSYMPPGGGMPGGMAPLRINLRNAVGAGLAAGGVQSVRVRTPGRTGRQLQTGSNLALVLPNGAVLDAITSGYGTIGGYLVGPDGALYVYLQSKTMLEPPTWDPTTGSTTSPGLYCSFVRVVRTSDVPQCIDPNVDSLNWWGGWGVSGLPVQFDASGAVYYSGSSWTGGGTKTVLRKIQTIGEAPLDLVADSINVQNFVVLDNGTVIFSGYNQSGAYFTRRITPAGGLVNVFPSSAPNFMRKFPDGKLYMGYTGSFGPWVRRWDPGLGGWDPKPWIFNEESVGYGGDTPHHSTKPSAAICADLNSFCTDAGAYSSSFVQVAKDGETRIYTVSGNWFGGNVGFAMIWSDPSAAIHFRQTTIKTMQVVRGAGSKIIVAGLAVNGAGDEGEMLVVYDPFQANPALREIRIVGFDEVDVDAINWDASANRVVFSGTRFADNKPVIGRFNPDTITGTGEIEYTATRQLLKEFQIF